MIEEIILYLIVGYCTYYVVHLVYKSVTGKQNPCCSENSACDECSSDKKML